MDNNAVSDHESVKKGYLTKLSKSSDKIPDTHVLKKTETHLSTVL